MLILILILMMMMIILLLLLLLLLLLSVLTVLPICKVGEEITKSKNRRLPTRRNTSSKGTYTYVDRRTGNDLGRSPIDNDGDSQDEEDDEEDTEDEEDAEDEEEDDDDERKRRLKTQRRVEEGYDVLVSNYCMYD